MIPTLMSSSTRFEQSPRGFPLAAAGLFFLSIVVIGSGSLLPRVASGFVVPAAIGIMLGVAFAAVPKVAVLAYLLIALFNDTIAIYFGDSVKSVDEAGIVALVGMAIWKYRLELRRGLSPLRDGALAIAATAGVLGSLLNSVPVVVWVPSLLLLLKGIALFHVTRSLPYGRNDAITHALTLIPLGFVLLGLGAVEFWDPVRFQAALSLPEYVRYRAGLPSVKSLFFHPVLFGWFMAYLALFLFAGFIVLRRWWMLVAALLLSMGTVLSARRKPLVGMAAALLVGAAATIPHRASLRYLKPWAVIFCSIVLLVVLFAPVLTGLYSLSVSRYVESVEETITSVEGDEPTLPPPGGGEENSRTAQARTALYIRSVAIAWDHFPFGAGLGRYGSWMSRVEYSPVYEQYGLHTVPGLRPHDPRYATDTFWPMVLGELGAVGLVAYGVFVMALAWNLLRGVRKLPDGIPKAFVLGALLIYAEGVSESLAAPSLVAPPVAYFVFGTAGAALSFVRDHGRVGEPHG